MDEGSKQHATNIGSNSITTEAVTDDDDEVLSSPEVELVELVPDDEDDEEEDIPLLLADDLEPQRRSKKKRKKKKKKSKKKKKKPPKTRTMMVVALLLIVWIAYRVLHRNNKKEIDDGDESAQLPSSSLSSSSSSPSPAPTTSMPTASPTPYVRTIAPGDEPRPQLIFLFQYHKTGHAIDRQYRKAVNHVAINNFKGKYTFGVDTTNEWKITKELVTVKYISTKNTVTRTNEPSGCTALNDGWKHDHLQSNATSPSHILLVNTNCGPYLFCNISENDAFGQYPNSSKTLHHDVKVVHMLRDPFDMAVSNYLYHSQDPTPEHWVIETKEEIPYNPCVIDHETLSYVTDSSSLLFGGTTPLFTAQDVEDLELLCHDLMFDPKTMEPYPNYYEALRNLPLYDGLRLGTMVLLASKGYAGAELVRMTTNVWRLNEWQAKQQQQQGPHTLLSLEMGRDWSKDYNGTLDKLTTFLLRDLEPIVPDNSSSTFFTEASHHAKEDFVAAVREEAWALRASLRTDKHVTGNTITSEEREELEKRLGSDKLLGPILVRMQTIVNSAYGMSPKYQ